MQTAAKARTSAPVRSCTSSDYSIEYGRQPHVTLNEIREARSQLIVLPEAGCEEELYWREPGQARRGIQLEGTHVIYIPAGVPYVMEWKRRTAWVRFSFTPEFIRRSVAVIPQPRVYICHEWKNSRGHPDGSPALS
jgi:hypothetical protein